MQKSLSTKVYMGVNVASSIDNLSRQDITFLSTLQWNYFIVENAKNWHFITNINGHALQYACILYISKKTYARYLKCQNKLEVYQMNVETIKRETNNIKRGKKKDK
jgi:hypothetical protein